MVSPICETKELHRTLLCFFEAIKWMVKVNIGLPERKFVYQSRKGNWDSDLCFRFPKLCMLNYGGNLGLRIPFRLTSCGINIVRSKSHPLFNRREDLSCGNICCSLGW